MTTLSAQRPAPTLASLNWLRAGVLGANDGIVSVAATVLGVAGAATAVSTIAVAGIAALFAGALSMAAGEYVSVSSQRHAAIASFASFLVGGVVPLLVVLAPWGAARVPATFAAVVVALVVTGLVAARFSDAEPGRAVVRNVLGGSVAMAVTFGVGALVGLSV